VSVIFNGTGGLTTNLGALSVYVEDAVASSVPQNYVVQYGCTWFVDSVGTVSTGTPTAFTDANNVFSAPPTLANAYVTINGAGVAGANLSTTFTGYTLYSGGTLATGASTSVTTAPWVWGNVLGTTNGTTTLTAVFDLPNTSGNTLVVISKSRTTGSTIADTNGNTWTKESTYTGDNWDFTVWVCLSCLAGTAGTPNTVTVTAPGTVATQMLEMFELPPQSAFDQAVFTSGGPTPPAPLTGTITPSTANETIIVATGVFNSSTAQVSQSFVQLQYEPSGDTSGVIITSDTNPITVSIVQGNGANVDMAIVAFESTFSASALKNGTLQVGGVAPSVSTMATSWTLPSVTLAANEYAPMNYSQTQSASAFGPTILPGPSPGQGDCFVQCIGPLQGSFNSAAFTFAMGVLVSGGTLPTGSANLVYRLWFSGDGISFTELTYGPVNGGTINLATTSQQNTTVTTPALNALQYPANAFLYLQVALEVQSGAVPSGCNVALVQDGTHSVITTSAYAASPTTTNLMTVSLFFYTGTVPSGGDVAIVCFNLTQLGTGALSGLFINGDGSSTAHFSVTIANNTEAAGATSSLGNKSWYFLACTLYGSVGALDNIQLYWAPIGSPTITQISAAASFNQLSVAEIDVGWTGVTISTAGAVASLRIWSGALTQAELQRESLSLEPVRTADLLEHWPFATGTDFVGRIRGTVLLGAGGGTRNSFGSPLSAGRRGRKKAA
jgi:hypothetical protein